MMSTIPTARSAWVLHAFLALVVHAPAAAQDPHLAKAPLPRLEDLQEGWNELVPGGETSCVSDPDYRFFARPADPERLLVYFQGGGACWNGETCAQGEPIHKPDLRNDASPPAPTGILDLRDAENSFASHSIVFVSYCTGDVHLGNADTTYIVHEQGGGTRQLAIRHRGHVNAMAALSWVRANFTTPREIFVAGSSAGAVATPFYASVLANQYPGARVIALGDDAGTYGRVAMDAVDQGRWRFQDVVRQQSGWENFPGRFGVEDLYVTAARSAPNLRLYQVDHAHDQAQRRYHELAGTANPDMLALLRETRSAISGQVPEFRAYTAGGTRHRILDSRTFYGYATNGHRLTEWVAALVNGDTVPTVDCTECIRPEFVYRAEDLAIIDHAIELLSTPGAWLPQDATSCPQMPVGRYTLRCALREAFIQVVGVTPATAALWVPWVPPVMHDVGYTTAERVGDVFRRGGDPNVIYNNRPGATLEEMITVLETVRGRVRAGLQRTTPRLDVVEVAPPTGNAENDRRAIMAALEAAGAGDTIRFAEGTYVIGDIIPVPQAGITLEGHADGTTLRGCRPEEYPRQQEVTEAIAAGELEPEDLRRCEMMVLTGGGVTVRRFTVEYTGSGFCISVCVSDPSAPVGDTVGGYRIEDNIFRNSFNGVRGQVVSTDTSVIRNNRFINTYHAVSFLEASNLQVLDNEISAPEPEAEPGLGHVSFAIAVGGGPNLIARNSIEGHPDGILLAAFPGSTTRGNVIRENTITVARNRLPDGGSPALASRDASDSTIVGVPLALHGLAIPRSGQEPGQLYDNLVEENRILGAEGIGIELTRASGNRIVGNQVSSISPRHPFPGNSVSTNPLPWRTANGAGIWVSRASEENEIRGNAFQDIAGSMIVLEGDRNRVSATNGVKILDLGSGNQVTMTQR